MSAAPSGAATRKQTSHGSGARSCRNGIFPTHNSMALQGRRIVFWPRRMLQSMERSCVAQTMLQLTTEGTSSNPPLRARRDHTLKGETEMLNVPPTALNAVHGAECPGSRVDHGTTRVIALHVGQAAVWPLEITQEMRRP